MANNKSTSNCNSNCNSQNTSNINQNHYQIPEDRMHVQRPIIVRSYDVDFMGIVNNTVFVKWLEDLRMAILDEYYPLENMLKDDSCPILAQTSIQYLHPVTLESHPLGICDIWLTGRSRWVAVHTIKEDGPDGKVYATAQQTGYYFNIQKHRPVPFPDVLIDQFMLKDK